MKNITKYFFLVFLGGCASIVSKTDYPLTINSNVPEASVSITDRNGVERYSGMTPATAILPAGDGYFTRARYEVKVSKPGYDSSKTNLKASIDPWYWGNFLFGGLIGLFIVDPLTGAMFKLDPQILNSSLTSTQSPVLPQNTENKSTATNTPNSVDLTKKLEEIKNLKDKGLISQSDFESHKTKILNSF